MIMYLRQLLWLGPPMPCFPLVLCCYYSFSLSKPSGVLWQHGLFALLPNSLVERTSSTPQFEGWQLNQHLPNHSPTLKISPATWTSINCDDLTFFSAVIPSDNRCIPLITTNKNPLFTRMPLVLVATHPCVLSELLPCYHFSASF